MNAKIVDNKPLKASPKSNDTSSAIVVNGVAIKSVYINNESAKGSMVANATNHSVDLITNSIRKIYIDGTDIPVYEGTYTAVPEVEAQTLYTKNKYLENDISIFKIPVWETDNETGTTVYIGKDNTHGL